MLNSRTRLIVLSVFLLVITQLCACARKPSAPSQPPATAATTIVDVREFPQNLEIYAKQVMPNRALISEQEQLVLYSSFLNIYFGPWNMTRTSISRREASSVSGRARGYKRNGEPWTQPEWQALLANAQFSRFPSRNIHAITLRQTDLRELPTHEMRFVKPTPKPELDPFDYFQYSSLPPGTPLLIAHTSQDGRWHYVECPIAGGWVDSSDIAIAGPEFRSLWRKGRYAGLIRDKVNLPAIGAGGKDAQAGIGTVLPLVSKDKGAIRVLVPIKEKDGTAGTAEIDLSPADATVMPLPLTAAKVAQIGNCMMGQPYGWGGMLGLRDCSATIRDLFTPFGLWLPRNSAAQARRGQVVRLDGMSANAKAETIMRDGKPFLSLVGLPGHITLYVGNWKNKPALFHNVWGLRIIKDGNDDERFVIGKAVVTSIMPGMELDNLYRPKTFGDRIRTVTLIGTR